MKTVTRKLREGYDYIKINDAVIKPNQRLTVKQLIKVCELAESGDMSFKVECVSLIGKENALYIPTDAGKVIKAINEDIENPSNMETETKCYFTWGFDALYIGG